MRLPARVAGLAALLSAVIAGAPCAAMADAPRTGHGPPGLTTTANPWLHRRVMNMAHAGGEDEAPGDTMYAFERAARLGADMIELDVQSTSDDRLVVMHNATLDPTTNGTGLVRDQPFHRVHALDAAYYFVPGRGEVTGLPASSYPLRGVRTHDRRPPRGYRAGDFSIPSLSEVLRTFRHTPVNIEIKGTSDADTASYVHNARLLAALLNRTGRRDVIVTSFNDTALAEFHRLAPRVSLAPGQTALMAYYFTGVKPMAGTVALQIPVRYEGIDVATKDFIARAHADGYAVHVWLSGTAPDDATTYGTLIDACADGIMAGRPTLLERILDRRHIVRPGRPGVDPCRT